MVDPRDTGRIGGQEFHVGDCRVWAEIQYLDSETNYRECLLDDSSRHERSRDEEIVMLADATPSWWRAAGPLLGKVVSALTASGRLLLGTCRQPVRGRS